MRLNFKFLRGKPTMLTKKLYLFLIILFLTIGFSFSSYASNPSENEPETYVSVNAFTNKTDVKQGDVVRLGIEQIIYPNWHTYWFNPGDSGLAFDIVWDLPEGFSVTPLEWATPSKIPFSDLTNYGYEEKVTLLQNLNVPQNYSNEPLTIKGKVNLLVCHDICIPETHEVEITLNDKNFVNVEAINNAEQKLPIILDVQANFYEQDGNFIIDIQGHDTDFDLNEVFIAPEDWGAVDNNANASVIKNENGFSIRQKRGERDLAEIENLGVVISSKDKSQAYKIMAKASANKNNIAPAPAVSNDTVKTETKQSITFIKAFIFALLGGLILNLMPCVFPVLSMKALSLAQLNGKEQSKAKLYGLSYTAGILISFAVIAGILIGLKAAGAEIGWGFQLQNPIVITLLTYLVFIIGLNLAGFFEFSNNFGNAGQKLANQSGSRGAFFTGVLATLVATPCTAPFMGVAMGYALTQGAIVALLVFMALGFGLALPYLALCFIPALRTKLPKPGVWMEKFKEFLSFPMFLTAAFLIWVLSQQSNNIGMLLILSALIAITFVIWLWRVLPKAGFAKIISLLALGLSVLYIISAPLMLEMDEKETVIKTHEEHDFTLDKLNSLLEGNHPVFTNMTAAWCITCKVNERVAIKTNAVQEIFNSKNIKYLKGDWTNRNPEITHYLNSFDRQGVPLYVYYGARDDQTGQRPEPVVLPQILTAGLIKDVLE